MTPRSTPLHGFKPPFVKDGEIVLPVLTGSGDYAELAATPVMWASITKTLAPVVNAQRALPADPKRTPAFLTPAVPEERAPIQKPSGGIL